MLKVVSVEAMRRIEAAANASGLTYAMMMQNAGRAVAERVLQLLAGRPDARVTVLVGPGNNGGDGLVAARIIAQDGGAQVRLYLLKPRPEDDPHFQAAREAGLFIAHAPDDHDFRLLRNLVASADVVVDALFGIGVNLPLRSDAAKVLRNVQQALHDDQHPVNASESWITPTLPEPVPRLSPYVVALDCPSGLDCDTGALDQYTLSADETITFIAAKPGLFEFPGAASVGQVHIAPIGVPADLAELVTENTFVVDAQTARQLMPARPANANKGTFGKALIVAGSTNYVGAAGLSALAAYRVGTGLVTVGAAAPVAHALASTLLEPTWLLLPHDMGVLTPEAAPLIQNAVGDYDALLLGPGLGQENPTRDFMLNVLEKPSENPSRTSSRRAMGFASTSPPPEQVSAERKPLPWVIDADALNLLSRVDEWWTLLPENTLITPHPGEMSRLAKIETKTLLANRPQIARECAAAWNLVLVLKGAHTLVAEPGGRLAVLPFKTDALATAGTGDVLAGMITGFLAQGLKPFDAAVLGTYLHGLAGEQAAARHGNTRSVIASDVLNALPAALTLLING